MGTRYTKLYLFFTILLLLGYSWLGYVWTNGDPGQEGLRLCFFHLLTGYPCPSCGTTRSVVLLMGGSIYQALLINPLGFIAATGLVIFPLLLLHDAITQKTLLANFYHRSERFVRQPIIAGLLILLLLSNWVWNIYKEL